MGFAAFMSRTAIAFDPDQGREVEALFDGLAPEVARHMGGAAGSSPYLNGLIRQHADWLRSIIDMVPADLVAQLSTFDGEEAGDLGQRLRAAKGRLALYLALADLAGVLSTEDVTIALTDFAGNALQAALVHQMRRVADRGLLPGMAASEIGSDTAGLAVLAMGKMGAKELNYSSDIDLIFLFDEARWDPTDFAEARMAFVRVTRGVAAMLSDRTAAGYVFRTDLRLRPDASVTPVAMSMEAAERYYESAGRTWERAAYIKARAAAGDTAAGAAFLDRLAPFVWRRHLDFVAIEDAHGMRRRIRTHKRLFDDAPLQGFDIKLGRGGIRDIEFFAQTQQLIAGGRDPSLRVRGTTQALAALADAGWIAAERATDLARDYWEHRTLEHRLQMIRDAQTHALPVNADEFRRLACLSGQTDAVALEREIAERLRRVQEATEPFYDTITAPRDQKPAARDDVVARWLRLPALRSDRARARFRRLRPVLFERLEQAARPDEAFASFESFLAGLPAGVQLFALFEANPQLVELIVDIAATAPGLAQYLGRNAQVLDAVIDGDFFAPWPGQAALTRALGEVLEKAQDYEQCLDAARRWAKEWHFRVGVHFLRGLISAETAGREYADLADAVLTALMPVVTNSFAAKHGPPPGLGAMVVGMGSMGVRRLSTASDLDLIVIYDGQDAEISTGPRPLPTRSYYARLTQALVTALSAPMSEGRLYEVDMRLRPSGRQGPVATAWSSYQRYQRTEAWTWEHLALTRARAVTSPPDLTEAFENFRQELVQGQTRPAAKIASDTVEMRTRLAEAKKPDSVWEVKDGAGALRDIELLAQAGALTAGLTDRSTRAGLAAIARQGYLGATAVDELVAAYELLGTVQAASRLLTNALVGINALGLGGQRFLLTQTGTRSLDQLEERLMDAKHQAARHIETALERMAGNI
ncbi:MAG: glutamine-synthetase adenylyltransferase [Pseudomonadota bacterium]